MTPSRQTCKLAELRAKTDRQLVDYLSAQLDRGLAWAETGEFLTDAESVHREVRRLLPFATSASYGEWQGLETRLNELREMLDGYRADRYEFSSSC